VKGEPKQPWLFDIWVLGSAPESDPLDREFMGVNLRESARSRDFDDLHDKLSRMKRRERPTS
jgi:hypothetical protein